MKQETVPPIEHVAEIGTPAAKTPSRSISIFRKRVQKFRRLKRGYYSFLILTSAYLLSFALPLLINNEPLLVRYHGQFYVPFLKYYPASDFGLNAVGEADYRQLKQILSQQGS